VYYGKLAEVAGNKKVREMKKSAKADDANTRFGVPVDPKNDEAILGRSSRPT